VPLTLRAGEPHKVCVGTVNKHPLEGEVAEEPEPRPPIGRGIVQPQGDSPAAAGPRLSQLPVPGILLCGRVLLVAHAMLHRRSFSRGYVPTHRNA
jgi:hypothetical protein